MARAGTSLGGTLAGPRTMGRVPNLNHDLAPTIRKDHGEESEFNIDRISITTGLSRNPSYSANFIVS